MLGLGTIGRFALGQMPGPTGNVFTLAAGTGAFVIAGQAATFAHITVNPPTIRASKYVLQKIRIVAPILDD